MQKVSLWFILILSLHLTACNLQSRETAALPSDPRDACPVTQPPDPRFIPPEPYPQYPEAGSFWYGSADLWTAVTNGGILDDLPHDENGYREKLFFWSREYAGEVIPALTVTGQRLDSDAPAIMTDQATNGSHPTLKGFMLTGLTFPTAGCWEITGHYQEHELSFVVWIGS